MDTKKIEEISVSALNLTLNKSNRLNPFISTNDKEPSWDGSVHVLYPNIDSNSNISKNMIMGRVPIQVKGTSIKLPKNNITFQVNLSDLKNFQREVGAIYFVVFVNENFETKIYYSDLLPVKLNRILSSSEAKKKITIQLKELPNNTLELEKIFYKFLDNNLRQARLSDNELISLYDIENNSDFKGLNLFNTRLPGENPYSFIFDDEVYAYARTGESKVAQPIKEILTNITLSFDHQVDIKIKDKTYYNVVRAYKTKNQEKIKIGNSVYIIINENDTMYTQVNLSNNIREIVRDLDFIIAAFDNKGFYFDNAFIDFDISNKTDGDFNLNFERERLAFFKKCIQMLDDLKCYDDFSIKDLSVNEWTNLTTLVYSIVDGNKIKIDSDKSIIIIPINIGLYSVLIIAIKQNDEYLLYDYNRVEFDHFYYSNVDDPSKKFDTSKYLILDSDLLSKVSNLNYYLIKKSFNSIQDLNTKYSDSTHFLLEVLKASDICRNENHKKDLLLFAEDFSKWIFENDPNEDNYYTNKLNYYQSLKRQNKLTDVDRTNLIKIDKEVPGAIYKYAANLLLDRYEDALYYLNELTEDDKSYITELPISFFLNKESNKI